MTRRRARDQESFEGLQLRDEVTGTPCPLDTCAAHTDPDTPCAVDGHPARTPHIARITATRKDKP